jgi:hypothetical protein
MEAFIKFGTGVVAIVALVLGVFALNHSQSQPQPGSTAGPDNFYPVETHNGVTTYFFNQKMNQGTTTVCSFKSPSATTTMARPAFMNWTVGSTTAGVATIAKGIIGNTSSTTLIAAGTVAAGAQGTLMASSTGTGVLLDNVNVIAPNTYINFSFSGGNGTWSPTGSCTLELER